MTKYMLKNKLRVGDIVIHEKKRCVVAGTKGWVHKGGWVSLSRNMGEISLLTRVEKCKLVLKREMITKNFWKFFPEGEK